MSILSRFAVSTIAVVWIAANVVVHSPMALAQGPQQELAGGSRSSGETFSLGSINNDRVSNAQQTLSSRGFIKARSIEMNGRQYDLWYNSGFRNSCVGFTSMNGWVRDARDFRDNECGYGGGRDAPWSGGGFGEGQGGRGGFSARELEGLRVDSAKATLRDHGFNYSRAMRIDGRQYDLWANSRTCVGFASYNGRVSDARTFSDAECGGFGGGGPGRGGSFGGGRIDARTLEGLRVDSAKATLRDRGFGFSRAVRIDGRQYDLWANGRTCVGFTSYNGQVSDARSFDERECR